jgi:hypothetical protein
LLLAPSFGVTKMLYSNNVTDTGTESHNVDVGQRAQILGTSGGGGAAGAGGAGGK